MSTRLWARPWPGGSWSSARGRRATEKESYETQETETEGEHIQGSKV
jgi:hypothetical protein